MEPTGSRGLTRVATYRRVVRASLERVWENVFDWEHLPWLHAGSFRTIERRDAGPWGWRARVELEPRGEESELELVVERDAGRYVTRTLQGRGAGSEIWTTLRPCGPDATDISVAFEFPGVAPERSERLGAGYVRLYSRLWDEDEAMMQRRERELARLRQPRETPETADLGRIDELRSRLPFTIAWAGRSFRIVEHEGELLAYVTVCPHMLGPLGEGALEDGRVRCPWHGYRFALLGGRCSEAPQLRLPPAPRVAVDADGRVSLVAPGR